jgi:hypothetical protein
MIVAATGIPLMTGLLIKKLVGFWRRLWGNVAEESAEPFPREARLALGRLGMGQSQLRRFAAGEPVAFNLPGATPGIITVAQLTAERRLRVGIYTIKKEGDVLGALFACMTFEGRSQDAAKAVGVKELELLGIEITSPEIQAVLERGGFTPTTIAVPEELGGGTFNAISRVEPVDQPEERIT